MAPCQHMYIYIIMIQAMSYSWLYCTVPYFLRIHVTNIHHPITVSDTRFIHGVHQTCILCSTDVHMTCSMMITLLYHIAYGIIDINECAKTDGLCGEGDCVNTPGAYVCDCNKGYELGSENMTCIGK